MLGLVEHAVLDVRVYGLVVDYDFIDLKSSQLSLWEDVTFLVKTMAIQTLVRLGPFNSVGSSLVRDRWRLPTD